MKEVDSLDKIRVHFCVYTSKALWHADCGNLIKDLEAAMDHFLHMNDVTTCWNSMWFSVLCVYSVKVFQKFARADLGSHERQSR